MTPLNTPGNPLPTPFPTTPISAALPPQLSATCDRSPPPGAVPAVGGDSIVPRWLTGRCVPIRETPPPWHSPCASPPPDTDAALAHQTPSILEERMARRAHPNPALSPNIAWLLRETAATRGHATAIRDGLQTTTYAELQRRSSAFAAALAGKGIEPGDRVAILLDRGAEAAAAFFGAAAVGAIAVIINETLRPRQIEHILDHSTASLLIASPARLAQLVRPLSTSTPLLDPDRLSEPGDILPVPRTGHDPAKLIYTSGSTGAPKGVTISHANLWAGMHAVTEYLEIDASDRIASLLPFSFDYGFNQLLCAVGAGATLVVERSPLPREIVRTIRAEGVTVLPAVPPLWLQLLQTGAFTGEPIPAIRAMTNTGGRIPADAVERIRRAQPQARLFLMYGLTEAFRATYLPPDQLDRRPDSIGRAIPGAEIMILRDDGSPCAPGEVGELVQRGPTVALGYWNDPEATTRTFRPNPLRPEGTPLAERVVFSGDLARCDEEGFFYFVGRRDKMIKTLGYRVSPDEVADALFDSGEIADLAITTCPDPRRGERIIAHFVLRAGGSIERLQDFARSELPRYMQPTRFIEYGALPRTTSGKHDLAALSAVPPLAAARSSS